MVEVGEHELGADLVGGLRQRRHVGVELRPRCRLAAAARELAVLRQQPVGVGLFDTAGVPLDLERLAPLARGPVAVGHHRHAAGTAVQVDRQHRAHALDLLRGGTDANTTLAVNRYIWAASLEVLNFLPVQSADPFSGVLVTGFGTPPGGGRAYRAVVTGTAPPPRKGLYGCSIFLYKRSIPLHGHRIHPRPLQTRDDARCGQA